MLLLEAPLGLGRGASQPAWGQVGEWVGQVPSSAWAAGKFIATKLLPIGQTIESCIQIAEAIADLIEQHQPPKWEYLGGLCGEECEGDEAAAQAAWCWLEW